LEPVNKSVPFSVSPFPVTDARGLTTATYDTRDRLLSETRPDGTAIAYAYDAAGNRTNLTTTVNSANETTTYAFDAVGNRTFSTEQGISRSYTYDANDRLLSAGGDSYTYDANGNTLTKSTATDVTTYSYDANDRLIGMQKKGTDLFSLA